MADSVVRAVHGGEVVVVRLPSDATRALAALDDVERDLTGVVRVVVLSAQDGDFACDDVEHARSADALRLRHDVLSWLRRPDLISIAAIGGRAFGTGLQVALACDFRVLGADAELAVTEVAAGAVAALVSTSRLAELAGPAAALELMITGRRLSATQAAAHRLANLVVPAGELDAAVDDLVCAVLAAPRAAVTEAKALLAASVDDDELVAELRLLDGE